VSEPEGANATNAGSFTTDEMMSVAASRELKDGVVCFVGIGIPSQAANLARATHAPNCVLIYESGTIGAKPEVLPLSIGDGELAEHADSVVSVPKIFNYWLQAGRVDVGFLGAAQIDVVVLRQSKRAFVEELSFVTSVGHAQGGETRKELGYPGAGPTVVITDYGVMRPDPETKDLTLTALHPGATLEGAREATGWDLRVAEDLGETAAPTDEELAALRGLIERTAASRSDAAG
jgi:glutaconate CoA-transferase subunit B